MDWVERLENLGKMALGAITGFLPVLLRLGGQARRQCRYAGRFDFRDLLFLVAPSPQGFRDNPLIVIEVPVG